MKQAFILIQVVLISIGAMAQGGPQANITAVPVNGFFPHFNIQQVPRDTSSRLIEKVHSRYYNGLTIGIDSVTYSYKNDDRGGMTKKDDPNNDENISFDESYTYQFNTSANQYDNRLRRTQMFNSSNKIISLLYSGWNVNKYGDSTQYIYTYTNNLMVESDYKKYVAQQWSTVNLSTLDYDLSNNVINVNSTVYNAKFTYDASNNLTSTKDSIWTQSTGWHYNQRKTYTYFNNDVQDYKLEQWDMTTNKWVYTKKWVYIYNAANDMTGATEYNWNNGNWDVFARNTYTFDNNHNKISDARQVWDANNNVFINQKRESWIYNSFNQPLLIYTESWNGTAWAKTNSDDQIRFSYQVYFPVSTPNLASVENKLSIYPIPATDYINIDIKWHEPQTFTAMISDLNGKVITAWTEQSTTNYHKNIPVAEMPAGNYFIKLAGDKGEYACQRFIVTH